MKNRESCNESIVTGGEPAELKHLSRQRKRNQKEISKVAASEMERGQTVRSNPYGVRTAETTIINSRTVWEDRPKKVRVL